MHAKLQAHTHARTSSFTKVYSSHTGPTSPASTEHSTNTQSGGGVCCRGAQTAGWPGQRLHVEGCVPALPCPCLTVAPVACMLYGCSPSASTASGPGGCSLPIMIPAARAAVTTAAHSGAHAHVNAAADGRAALQNTPSGPCCRCASSPTCCIVAVVQGPQHLSQ